MLEYPGVGFPVSVVDSEIDVKDTTYLPMNDQDKFNYDLTCILRSSMQMRRSVCSL